MQYSERMRFVHVVAAGTLLLSVMSCGSGQVVAAGTAGNAGAAGTAAGSTGAAGRSGGGTGGLATDGPDASDGSIGGQGGGSGGSLPSAGSSADGGNDTGRENAGAAGSNPDGNTVTPFVHPGILHTTSDLARMKSKVAAGAQPYFDGYKVFRTHPLSSATYTVKGGFAEMGRNPDVNTTQSEDDADAAYQTAIMWAITGDRAYAQKSIQILDIWSAHLTTISGLDAILAAGFDGYKFVNAAEIIRYTDAGWSPAGIAAAEKMFRGVFYPVIQNFATYANGNWSLACIMTMMGIGVFTDDHAMFGRAVDWYYSGSDNGRLTNYIINDAGQGQESGRDQGHAQLGIGSAAQAAEIGWNQGLDMYGAVNNRLLAGFEYTASYNLGNTVPFVATVDTTGKYPQTRISAIDRGMLRPIYEMAYNHYKVRRGIPCPYTEQAATKLRPEGAAIKADPPGFGTLLFTQ